MIPKIVHYCWFGGADMPPIESRCVEGWATVLPDFEFKCWNESSFDIESIPYVKEAYRCGKFAFVSDVVRMYALVQHGGVYLDTDVELLQPIDDLLTLRAFCGYENRTNVGTAVIGAEKGFPLFREMLMYYENRSFVQPNGSLDETTNVQVLERLIGQPSSGLTDATSCLQVYPRPVFFPRRLKDGSFEISDETRAIHHGSASWLTDREKRRGSSLIWRNVARPVLRRLQRLLVILLGEERAKRIELNLRERIR